MARNQDENSPRTYWALLPARSLLPHLRRRREEFLGFFDSSGLYRRIWRNWELYHGINETTGHGADDSVQVGGDEGELRLVKLNEFRSAIGLLKTYITSQRPEWDTLAQSDDRKALNSAKKGNQVLDGYVQNTTNCLEATISQAVEDGLILAAGWVWNLWDKMHGREDRADVAESRIYYDGEFRFLNPSFTDVVFDFTVRDFREARWLDARRQENKFDLAAEFPAKAEKILQANPRKEDGRYSRFDFQLRTESRGKETESDFVWVHYFYLKPSPAAPKGRIARYIEPDIVLEDERRLPGGSIPVHRIIPSQFLLTPFGFTPAFSGVAPQELLDMTASIIATNQSALGSTKVWKKPGETINRADSEPGITLLECETKPEPLNLLDTPAELYKSLEVYANAIRSLVGTNASAHGEPEPNLKSGAAIAFTEQRVRQIASDLVTNYDQLQADVGTSILLTLRERARNQREVNVQSAFTRKRNLVQFTGRDLEGVARVTVTRGNPLLRTLAGRVQVAEFLVGSELVKSKEEFMTVIQTGNLSKLTESEDNQLEIVHLENEGFISGRGGHVALPVDNHMLHIKRHAAILETPEARTDPNLALRVYGAILEHKEMLADPEVQIVQILLGYNPGPLAGLVLPQPPGGAGPAGAAPRPPRGLGQEQRPEGGPPQLRGTPEDLQAGGERLPAA